MIQDDTLSTTENSLTNSPNKKFKLPIQEYLTYYKESEYQEMPL